MPRKPYDGNTIGLDPARAAYLAGIAEARGRPAYESARTRRHLTMFSLAALAAVTPIADTIVESEPVRGALTTINDTAVETNAELTLVLGSLPELLPGVDPVDP